MAGGYDGDDKRVAADVARALKLAPHPEGGFFRETYRSETVVETPRGVRPSATAIAFLIGTGSPSHFHRLTSDELWIHQAGDPLELVTISPDGRLVVEVLQSVGAGGTPVSRQGGPGTACVNAGLWQAARVRGDDAGSAAAAGLEPRETATAGWALVSCVVTPGFDYADFELADRARLTAAFPAHAEVIAALS